MKNHRRIIPVIVSLIGLLVFGVSTASAQAVTRPAGWEDDSHSNDAELNYETVFPQASVNTITITIAPDEWQAIFDDMTTLYGEFGSRQGMGGMGGMMIPEGFEPPAGMEFPPNGQLPEGFEPPAGMEFPPNGQLPEGFTPPDNFMRGGGMLGIEQNPIWVAADIEFNGQTWTDVGFRLKGNSSLMSSWGEGNYKLPFKLDFDQFEDDYPAIKNQRFYGFKQLSFSSNWSDDSLLREKVTADLFREAGLAAAQTAFYAVYVDYGNGPEYFGLYTAVEVIEDTVIETQFADGSGNVYKPQSTFAAGTFDEDDFDKQTNEDEADYSDIIALYEALHAETRTTDPAAWRAGLEAVFDVDGFIRWLATNQVVQNWDTYGRMAHNYYLYNDPTTGLLTWIPWDNNMALSDGFGGGGGRGFGGGNRAGDNPPMQAGNMMRVGPGGDTLTIDLATVGENWPLIRFIMDDPVYHALYVADVDEVSETVFEPSKMAATYQALHDLIAPYVIGEDGEINHHTFLASATAFETALETLITHAQTRYTVAQTYVDSQQAD